VGLVAIVAVVFPVLAMSYLLLRVARRPSLRVWRATEGRPALRTLATVAGVAVLILVAWSWWPKGQYRPIEPSDRGTLLDATRASGTPGEMVLTSHSSASQTLPVAAGSVTPRLAVVVSEEGVPVTAPGPKRIIILPQPGQGSPDTTEEATEGEWVFPFDPPDPPGEGDNQALAVNTTDGSTVYDIAIAVVWVPDGGPVDNVNEAWALASCTDCTTMAAAFQSIFILGDADVVVPQNIAVAVNYECESCRTHAVAVQLVATLTRMPGPDAMAELERVWDELESLEQRMGGMTVEQLWAELERIEAQIVQILIDDGSLAVAEGTLVEASTETSDEVTDETAPAEPAAIEGTPDDTTTDDGTASDEGTGGATEPTTAPAEPTTAPAEPSPTPTEQPSPSPTAEPSAASEPSPALEPSPVPSP
jgi:putative peptide zinc metalloprotease protein